MNQRRLKLARLAARRGIIAVLGALWLCSSPDQAQISPEQHAQHHPAGAGGSGMATNVPGMGGMMEMMEGMMKGMGTPPSKALYPSLMGLPDLPPEKRAEVQQQARERMVAGVSLMRQSFDSLSRGMAAENYPLVQEATVQIQEGLAQFDSGVAAQRALAEGKAPRNVALQWFKREMNLLPPTGIDGHHGVFGLSWFHFFVMTVLVGFAVVVIWMYFHKMRRATLLLQNLTGGATPTAVTALAPAAAPPRSVPSLTAPASTQAAQSAMKRWSGNLRVGGIFQETPDVKTFRLMNPLGGPLPFSHLPGQFVTLTAVLDGKPVKRSYTVASSPTQHDYAEITVKHEAEGVVSDFLHNRVQQGDLLEFSGPVGSFIFTGRECKCILLIGGGVGITPLMSVLRYLTDRSWSGDIFLLYGVKTARDIIFREELDYLQRRHPNLRVVITVSRPEGTEWKGPAGRITKELIAQSVPDVASRYVHICGPVSMMEAAKKMLAELGVPPQRVKTEAFGPALGKPEPTQPPAAVPSTGTEVSLPTATFSLSDKSAPLPPDKTILEVADEISVEIDNSCRVGTCGTCRIKLLSGQVTMAVEDGLEQGDKEQGIILACQAKATANVEVEA